MYLSSMIEINMKYKFINYKMSWAWEKAQEGFPSQPKPSIAQSTFHCPGYY